MLDLEAKIKILGDFIWEVGPGFKKNSAFTLSPGGDPILLAETKKIISYAPCLDEWEFYYAKQIKAWNNYFDVFINDERQSVDISEWQYVLFQYEDDTFDIIIKPEPYLDIFDDDIHGICEMVLDSMLGEEIRIEKILEMDVVRELDADIKEKASFIVDLQKHLFSINHLNNEDSAPTDTQFKQ